MPLNLMSLCTKANYPLVLNLNPPNPQIFFAPLPITFMDASGNKSIGAIIRIG